MDQPEHGPALADGSDTGQHAMNRMQRKSPAKSARQQLPSPPADSPTRRGSRFNPGLLTPPSSQVLAEDEAFSPSKHHRKSPSKCLSAIARTRAFNPQPSTPTRQTASRSEKRKRATPSASDLRSPSPKKATTCMCGSRAKRILYKSVHANNVNVNYLPLGECPSRKCRMRSRSITPAYEPPGERFTPPREIEVVRPPIETPTAKSIRRNALSKVKQVSPPVKSEPPEIDLTQRPRPPSPGEDPILLSGNRPSKNPPLRSRYTPSFSSSPSFNHQFTDPPTSFAARLSGGRVNDFGDLTDSDVLPAPTILEAHDQINDDGWSDSDDDGFNLTGEYTGKYKMFKIPTKADPPTSGTREKMESWGRPLSPFPYSEILERSLPLSDMTEEDILEDNDQHPDTQARSKPNENVFFPVAETSAPPPPARADEGVDDSSDGDEGVEADVVKVTSGDPQTAAHAAAILNLHDYDCIMAASSSPKPSKRKRRKTFGNAGIIKPYTDLKERRRTMDGYRLPTPSADTTLHDIWRSTEDSVLVDQSDRERSGQWSRKHWKHLDKCLVAERLTVGASLHHPAELLAPFDKISKDRVLDRFVAEVGGTEALHSFGPQWSRPNLMLRLEILIRRQQRLSTAARAPSRHDKAEFSNFDRAPPYESLLQQAIAVTSSTYADAGSSTTLRDAWTAKSSERGPRPLPTCPRPRADPRAPITTPSRPAGPKPPPPKEQVHLRHASLPKKSMIPVLVRPRRLVDLRHWSPSKHAREQVRSAIQPRSSGGGGVKDLIKCFEGLDQLNSLQGSK
ncbi:hypothetical protein F5J12DRAFT_833487 [Pisolithus orientalis]|uniref:uncharacterized protein n=1 Tax=Pisolithus orientalis TaxID=936130 RepID=UPI00222553E9|nr:uncharacterized protein F5J12DRAFT_833487 [Pisolithus orientalis]KAI6006289.1 hypothetical protein F5J12DRAFT_833487 [Pisolithus orientalis]